MQVLTLLLTIAAFVIAISAKLPLPLAAFIAIIVYAVGSVIISRVASIGISEGRQRPALLTAWLVIVLLLCAVLLVGYAVFMADKDIKRIRPDTTMPMTCFSIAALAHAISIVTILNWRRWGYWALLGVALISFGFGVATPAAGYAVFALVNAAVVYGLLRLTVDGRSTWERLK